MPATPIITSARPSGWTILIVPPRPDKRPRAFRLRKRYLKWAGGFFGTLVLAFGALVAIGTLVHTETEAQLADAQRMVLELTDSLQLARQQALAVAMAPSSRVAVSRPTSRSSSRGRTRRSSDLGLAAPAPGVVLPVVGRITSRFARSRFHPLLHIFRPHHGVDIYAPKGTSITAPAAGRVVFAGRKIGVGLVVELDHGDGVVSHYAHCSSLNVKAGEYVTAGALIAKVGSTGLATGPHVHFEVRINGRPVDPLDYLIAPHDSAPSPQAFVERAGGDDLQLQQEQLQPEQLPPETSRQEALRPAGLQPQAQRLEALQAQPVSVPPALPKH